MLARGGGRDHQVGVAAGGRGDQHAVDVGTGEQLVDADGVRAEVGGQALGGHLHRIGHGDEPGSGDVVRGDRGVVGADAARADEGEAEKTVGHGVPRSASTF